MAASKQQQGTSHGSDAAKEKSPNTRDQPWGVIRVKCQFFLPAFSLLPLAC